MNPRCPWAIRFGFTLHTRCKLDAGHEGWHQGRGLAQFPKQVIHWAAIDCRAYQTNRGDTHAWEETPPF